jgi:hypothetical protein
LISKIKSSQKKEEEKKEEGNQMSEYFFRISTKLIFKELSL